MPSVIFDAVIHSSEAADEDSVCAHPCKRVHIYISVTTKDAVSEWSWLPCTRFFKWDENRGNLLCSLEQILIPVAGR